MNLKVIQICQNCCNIILSLASGRVVESKNIMKRVFALLFFATLSFSVLTGQSDTYTVKKAAFSSDKYDEFSPAFFNGGIVFSSNRIYGLSNRSNSQNKGLFKIYYVDTTLAGSKEVPRLFSKSLTSLVNDGPVTFNSTRDTIYFSRNQNISGKLSELSSPRNKLGIFSAVLINGEWTKVRDMRINNEWYNVTSPCLSSDGKRLYFASDKPGGMGGTDIYYCEWKNDYWNDPVNLGPVINTPGNESYPYVNPSGELFFSSDGHPGMGGKDIFYTRFADTAWLPPVHLDAPLNSQFDDFGIVTDSTMSEGFFSSRRDGAIHIYKFNTVFHQLFYCNPQRTNQYCFKFTDDSKIPIDEYLLQYVWSFGDGTKANGQVVEHCFPGPGKYQVRLDVIEKKTGKQFFSKTSYLVDLKDIEQPIIKSPGSVMVNESISFNGLNSYFPGYKVLSFSWIFGDGEQSMGDIVNHTYRKKGNYDVQLGLLLRNSKTKLIYQYCSSKSVVVFDDLQAKKSFDSKPVKPMAIQNIVNYDHAYISNLVSVDKDYNQDAVFQVELLASKTKLAPDNPVFANVPKSYQIKEVRLKNENLYSYIVAEELSLMNTYATFNDITGMGFKDARVRLAQPDDPASKELNTLKKVFGVSADMFFSPDDVLLSSTGTQILDQIIGFLSKYPGIRLEISVHSDNTGTPSSQILLTQRRADAMVNYLIKNGVSSLRLVSKGYGSTRPLYPEVSETYKKHNRRIDFNIVK